MADGAPRRGADPEDRALPRRSADREDAGLPRRSAKGAKAGWRSHTVRVRLTLWYVAAMMLVLAVYISVVFVFVTRNASQTLDQQLRRDFQWAAATVDVGPDGRVIWQAEPLLITGEEELPWVQVWTGDGRLLLFKSAEAQRRHVPESVSQVTGPINRLPDGGGVLEDDRGIIKSFPIEGEQTAMRILARPLPIRDQSFILQVGRSEAGIQQGIRELAAVMLFGFPIAIALAGLGGYMLARRALMPIERMTDRAQHITAERLGERLPVHNPDDEMGRLAAVFNGTLARLEESFGQMRRFTADVSHELRTPLTAIRSVGEVGLRGHRDEQAYRTIIGSMLEESDRLASLVDRLLVLSRAESSPANNPREALNLSQLVEDVATHLGVLAEEKGQSIVVDVPAPVPVVADRQGLRQAVINLVDNAIKFTPPGGLVQLVVRSGPDGATLDVVDSGPGVPSGAQDRIFDRFFRAASGEAGTGLGLSIAKGAIEATGGRLTLESSDENGSRFRIWLPA
jgi:heavy metal sensor kinase